MTADAAAELSSTVSKHIAVVPCKSWLDPRCCRGKYQLHRVTMGRPESDEVDISSSLRLQWHERWAAQADTAVTDN